ncbi:MAG: AraC family transcriptional regulator [Verrucomicrobia bacterium]|nr:AraC family transcriptional regulator [Cytophagales bacterium]
MIQKAFLPQLPTLTGERDLQTLVENRTVFAMNYCEMNLFETQQRSEKVSLRFNSLTFTAMLRGKKVMHLFGTNHFEYLPGESVIVPESEEMVIDFPDASALKPTQCLALAIDREKIKETIDLLNEDFAKTEKNDVWQLHPEHFHLKNSSELTDTIDRLVQISQENNKAKDIFANMALQELLIRLMQTQARNLIFDNYLQYMNSHRFAYVVKFIREHLTENVTIDKLSDLACMSKAHFFRNFKREFGISPVVFIIQERLKLAKKYLSEPVLSITEAGFRAGFNNLNYFCTIFKKYEGITPKLYKQRISGL